MSALSVACKKVVRSAATSTSRVRSEVIFLGTSAASIVDASSGSVQKKRSITLISTNFSDSKKGGSHDSLRNMSTSSFQSQASGYVSPYSDFFANIEAGRTSLGTTEEMEQKVSNLTVQKLDCGICESDLRFRTTSYGRFALPPYVAPGEHRVTVVLNLDAIPWDEQRGAAEKEVLLQIVGSRYNADKNELKLSSEKFGSRIENKRYLVGMIEKIVSNSRELALEFAKEDEKASAAS